MKRVLRKFIAWLNGLSFRTGVVVLALCIPFYIISFAQMALPISVTLKGVLWTVFFGLAKATQYAGLTILGAEGLKRLKHYFRNRARRQELRAVTNEVYIKNFYELSLDELYEILRCRAVVFGVEQQIVYADPDNIDRLSKHFFVKTAEGIAAYLRLIPEGVKFDDAVSIGRVLTMSPWRRKGLSRLLLEKAIASARADGAERIRIEAQAYLVDFYTSLGFVQTSQPYVLEGLMHIDMVKELTD